MKALASLARFRQAMCSSGAAASRMQFGNSQSTMPARCMAVARAVRSPAKDKDTEDITVEQKVSTNQVVHLPALDANASSQLWQHDGSTQA